MNEVVSQESPEGGLSLRRRLATSNHPAVMRLKELKRGLRRVHLPLPKTALRALQAVFHALRTGVFELYRFFVCDPLFRASCTKVGRGMRTGYFVHWVQGQGRLELGDDVTVDGKSSFTFASRYSDSPLLRIGDRTMIGHGCGFVVAKEVTIGTDCLLAMGVNVLDSSGHPVDPVKRLAGEPLDDDEVKPVNIGNNVWIGAGATIFPGVTIGDGAVVAARAVVVNNVLPYTLVAGYPARKLQDLTKPN